MSELVLTSPTLTHADLVQRAALWLRNQKNCRVVLTEQTTSLGEVPDAIGWKYGNCSYLIECKVSRSDFLADRCKPFRIDGSRGMGVYRYFMAPMGLLTVDDLKGRCDGWGLLLVQGRRVFVRREAEAQIGRAEDEEIAQLVQALAQAQMRVDVPLHEWLTGPDSPVGRLRAARREMRRREEERKRTIPM